MPACCCCDWVGRRQRRAASGSWRPRRAHVPQLPAGGRMGRACGGPGRSRIYPHRVFRGRPCLCYRVGEDLGNDGDRCGAVGVSGDHPGVLWDLGLHPLDREPVRGERDVVRPARRGTSRAGVGIGKG